MPDGIGKEPDGVVALREGLSRQAIQYLRKMNDIPPSSEPYRSRFIAERDLRPEDLGIGDWDGSF